MNPAEVLSAIEAEVRKRGLLPEGAPAPLPMLAQEMMRRGLVVFRHFRDYVQHVNPTLLNYAHVPRLLDVGERVVSGLLQNVMVLLPPRYFKTEIFGRLMASYYLLRHPMKNVALTSYGADLAWETSEEAQHNYLRSQGQVRSTVQAKRLWHTAQGGRMWAAGTRGTLTGRGFHLGLTDDPIKPDDVHSLVYQRRFTRWWPDTWLSRRDPGAQLVFVMQRLGPEDPIDFLFRREVGEKTEKAPLNWHVVVMDEIKSDEPLGRWSGPRGLPPTCTLEPDPRKVGEVLSPTLFGAAAVEASQKQAGPLTTASQRQQRPMRATGEFWRSSWFGEYTKLPEHAYNGGVDWDTAQSKEELNSATAWIRSYRGPALPDHPDEFVIYVEDVGWDHLEFPGLVKKMREIGGPHYVEAKSSGKSAVQALAAYSIKALEVQVHGDKLARASAAQPAVANGRILVNANVRDKLLSGERQGLLRVTAEGLQLGGEALDVNDAFVQAIHRHLGIGAEKKLQVRFR